MLSPDRSSLLVHWKEIYICNVIFWECKIIYKVQSCHTEWSHDFILSFLLTCSSSELAREHTEVSTLSWLSMILLCVLISSAIRLSVLTATSDTALQREVQLSRNTGSSAPSSSAKGKQTREWNNALQALWQFFKDYMYIADLHNYWYVRRATG